MITVAVPKIEPLVGVTALVYVPGSRAGGEQTRCGVDRCRGGSCRPHRVGVNQEDSCPP